MENGNGFDGWLERELQKQAAKSTGPSPLPSQAQYHAAYLQGGIHMSVLAKAASMVSTKAAVGIAVAVLAVGTAGVAAEAAVTGSASPTNWGQAVVKQVTTCKDALTAGQHGIGQCVSAFAKTHGKEVSAAHSNGASSHASDARANHPAGPPAGAGKPTNLPGGKPSNVPPSHP